MFWLRWRVPCGRSYVSCGASLVTLPINWSFFSSCGHSESITPITGVTGRSLMKIDTVSFEWGQYLVECVITTMLSPTWSPFFFETLLVYRRNVLVAVWIPNSWQRWARRRVRDVQVHLGIVDIIVDGSIGSLTTCWFNSARIAAYTSASIIMMTLS